MTGGLSAIRARAEKATPGPWVVSHAPAKMEESRIYAGSHVRAYFDGRQLLNERADAEFAAHAREDIPRLLAVAEAAKKLLAVTIGRRFTVEFCYQRPELPQVEWCKTCIWAEELRAALAAVEEGE